MSHPLEPSFPIYYLQIHCIGLIEFGSNHTLGQRSKTRPYSSKCKWYYDDDNNNNNNDNIFVYGDYGGVVVMVLVVLGWYWYVVRMVNGKVVARTP